MGGNVRLQFLKLRGLRTDFVLRVGSQGLIFIMKVTKDLCLGNFKLETCLSIYAKVCVKVELLEIKNATFSVKYSIWSEKGYVLVNMLLQQTELFFNWGSLNKLKPQHWG